MKFSPSCLVILGGSGVSAQFSNYFPSSFYSFNPWGVPAPVVPVPTPKPEHSLCGYWAQNGECDKNTAWMPQNCPIACAAEAAKKGCGGTCANQNKDCAYWAGIGECQKNGAYMNFKCVQSCCSKCQTSDDSEDAGGEGMRISGSSSSSSTEEKTRPSDDSSSTSSSSTSSSDCPAQSIYSLSSYDVKLTTYRDSACTDVAQTFEFTRNRVDNQLESEFLKTNGQGSYGMACNELPDSWSDRLVLSSTGITWYNYPNKNDSPCPKACDPDNASGNKFNELAWDPVTSKGTCTEIPGPVPTWKMINECPGCSGSTSSSSSSSSTSESSSSSSSSTSSSSSSTGTCANRKEPTVTGTQLSDVKIFHNGQLCTNSGGSVDCTADTVSTQSGPDSTCPNNDDSLHWWPINKDLNDCHGWQSVDPNGKLHDNAAKNIRCSSDGKKLLYDQYAGNIDCGGDATAKEFVLDECHQGVPPTLFDKARDLSCCGSN